MRLLLESLHFRAGLASAGWFMLYSVRLGKSRRTTRRSDGIEVDFERFAVAERVTLTTNLMKELALSDDPELIAALVEVLRPYSQGWEIPRQGVAVTSRRLNFFAATGRPLGNVGISERILTAHIDGGFLQLSVGPEPHRRCLALLGVQGDDGREVS